MSKYVWAWVFSKKEKKKKNPGRSPTIHIDILPVISSLTLILRKDAVILLNCCPGAVMEMLACTWIFWITPSKQKFPTKLLPSSSAKCREKGSLHSWLGRDCRKLPFGDTRSHVLVSGMLRCQVKLLRGIGRQGSIVDTESVVTGHDSVFLQSVIQKHEVRSMILSFQIKHNLNSKLFCCCCKSSYLNQQKDS